MALRHRGRKRKIVQRRCNRQTHPLLVHPTAFRDGTLCESDDRAVAQYGRTGWNILERNFVRFGNVLDQRQPRIELGSRAQTALVHDDGDRVVRMHLHVEGT